MDARYDVAVVGTGPAGLSAAITLKIRNKSILLLGSKGGSTKVERAHEVLNYLGIPNVTGEKLSEQFLDHIKKMEIPVTEEHITSVYAMGNYFALTTKTNKMYEATTVILSTGVSYGRPYPGEEELLGSGVSYCATCDAPLYKGKTVAVIGDSPKEEAEAEFLAEIAKKVYYIPTYKENIEFKHDIEVIRDVPVEVQGEMQVEKLVLKNGELNVDGVFILREAVSPVSLVPGLKMDGNHVEVNRKMETNLKGCFACGDITGVPYQYIKAAGEGNVAAISAVEYLAGLN